MKTNSTIHIVIFADEYYRSQNHLQIDTMKCYSSKKRLRLHTFGLNNTAECNHSINFHRRHCLLAEIMRTRVYTYISFAFILQIDGLNQTFRIALL